jgi:hypothetical protein
LRRCARPVVGPGAGPGPDEAEWPFVVVGISIEGRTEEEGVLVGDWTVLRVVLAGD